MRSRLAVLLALGAAACGGQGGGANQSGTASSGAVTTPLQAGRWEMTTRAVSMEVPNAPPEIEAQLRAQALPPAQVEYDCVTAQDAVNPMEGVRRQLIHDQPNLSCEPTSQLFNNGQIRVALDCHGLNGQADTQIAMVGSFTTTTMQAAVSTTTTTAINGTTQRVQVENTLTGRHVGECNGSETE